MANISAQKPRFSVAITTPMYQDMIRNTLSDPDRANRFIASITSAVAVNPALQECEASTILAGALLGESLQLSPSPQLGQFYLVPFNVKVKDGNGRVLKDSNGNPITAKHAQFVLGYRGYIQLAIRSGQYRKLNVTEIKEGELKRFDLLNEEIECTLIEDWQVREATETIGYYAMFEYLNGFRKALYWSKEKMEKHADAHSSAFNLDIYRQILRGQIPDNEMWKYSSFWYKDFDAMAKKTMLRQIISKWGIMSIEMQEAYEKDQSLTNMDIERGALTEINEADLFIEQDTPDDAAKPNKQTDTETVRLDELE